MKRSQGRTRTRRRVDFRFWTNKFGLDWRSFLRDSLLQKTSGSPSLKFKKLESNKAHEFIFPGADLPFLQFNRQVLKDGNHFNRRQNELRNNLECKLLRWHEREANKGKGITQNGAEILGSVLHVLTFTLVLRPTENGRQAILRMLLIDLDKFIKTLALTAKQRWKSPIQKCWSHLDRGTCTSCWRWCSESHQFSPRPRNCCREKIRLDFRLEIY